MNKKLVAVLMLVPVFAAAQSSEDLARNVKYTDVRTKDRDTLNDAISTSRRNAITRAVEKASPAVVGINVTEIREQQVSMDPFGGFFDNDPYLRQFFGRRGAQTQKFKVQSLGSGFLISSDGYILTNDHVAGNATKIIVTMMGGKQFDAKLVATDFVQDVSLLKIDGQNFPYLGLGNSDDVAVGEWAIALGNPFGLFSKNDKPTVTVGVISNTNVSLGYENGKNFRNMLQTDAAISSGNSGGPLLNANGEVIGINATIFSTTQNGQGVGSIGLGFAIPVNKVKKILDDFRSGKKIDRNIGALGFNAQTIYPEFKEESGINSDDGAVVTNLYRGSVAERAGIMPGDLIIAVDGEKVKTSDDLWSAIVDKKVGDVVSLSVLRLEGPATVKLKLPPKQK